MSKRQRMNSSAKPSTAFWLRSIVPTAMFLVTASVGAFNLRFSEAPEPASHFDNNRTPPSYPMQTPSGWPIRIPANPQLPNLRPRPGDSGPKDVYMQPVAGQIAQAPTGRARLIRTPDGRYQLVFHGTTWGTQPAFGLGDGTWPGNGQFASQEWAGMPINDASMIWARNELRRRQINPECVMAVGHSLGAWNALALGAEGTVRGGVVGLSTPGNATENYLIPALRQGNPVTLAASPLDIFTASTNPIRNGMALAEAQRYPNFYPYYYLPPCNPLDFGCQHSMDHAINALPAGAAGSLPNTQQYRN